MLAPDEGNVELLPTRLTLEEEKARLEAENASLRRQCDNLRRAYETLAIYYHRACSDAPRASRDMIAKDVAGEAAIAVVGGVPGR